MKISKKRLSELRILHNKVVLKEYQATTQWGFNDYFFDDLNLDDPKNPYIEISKYETKTGAPYILEIN